MGVICQVRANVPSGGWVYTEGPVNGFEAIYFGSARTFGSKGTSQPGYRVGTVPAGATVNRYAEIFGRTRGGGDTVNFIQRAVNSADAQPQQTPGDIFGGIAAFDFSADAADNGFGYAVMNYSYTLNGTTTVMFAAQYRPTGFKPAGQPF